MMNATGGIVDGLRNGISSEGEYRRDGQSAGECAARPLVDVSDRTVSSRAFTDPDIFALERATVFSRSWMYVGHRSQFTRKGDFIQTYAGTVPLLLCLDEDGAFHAIANVCSHRGGRICQFEYGNASKFVCPYHNWAFNNRGELIGVPRRASPGFDKSRWGLLRAARVSTYRDLVFCTFSTDSVPLDDYLGDMKWYLDLLLNSSGAGTAVSGGTHRSVVRCNWKIPAEQFGSDNWHFQGVHASMTRLGGRNEDPGSEDSFHAWTGEGHMLICIAPKVEVPSAFTAYLNELSAQGRLSELQRRLLRCSLVITVFPNLSFVYFPGLCSIRVWHPRAPGETELWSWALYNKDAPDPVKDSVRKQVTRMFSPTGMLEQDDLEVWARLESNLMRMPPSFRLCYEFGAEEHSPSRPFPGRTASLQSDTPAFAFYRRWAEVIAQPDGPR
jgi:phenylpropionate dioxygenase-like ring-hydroxylating dioxygenase large terminal subunit